MSYLACHALSYGAYGVVDLGLNLGVQSMGLPEATLYQLRYLAARVGHYYYKYSP